GRKNFLFCGNHDAAEDAAVIYSFMGCCKAADVDFKGWMHYFLNHVHEYDSDYSKDIAELLPSSLKDKKII
ncbi:IS66 family transposase, partial [Bacteroides caecigallinarum]|nr:IS66 family transposase [Bacteroides caecigallinarum]